MASKDIDLSSYDFCGWASRNDLKCSDGRTIRRDAFKDNDGQIVPLVWNHQHNEPTNVLGHALLLNKPEGIFTYGKFNDTDSGRDAKILVTHGDVDKLSIYANKLKQNGGDVYHGNIREVSLVLAGANPGAYITSVMAHSADNDGEDEELEICCGEEIELLQHSESEDDNEEEKDSMAEKNLEHADGKEKTVQDVVDTMTEEQKNVMYALIGMALEDKEAAAKHSDDDDGNDDDNNDEIETDEEEDEEMKHNVFDNDQRSGGVNVLTDEDIKVIFADAKRLGSLKESVLAHAEDIIGLQHDDTNDDAPTYGIANIEEVLFPDAKYVYQDPAIIKRDDSWVSKVLNGAHHSPFSRTKSRYADLTADAARAKGYIKGTEKLEEVFPMFKRSTPPTTIYKKQKMDRDDLIDITDFNVVGFLKQEMRMMLNEEIARAVLVGDGRTFGVDDDAINPACIRPIFTDTANNLYAFSVDVDVANNADEDTVAKTFIRTVIKNRKNYKGTGTPTLFTTDDVLTDMLLLEDGFGHALYESVDKLATKLRVKEIVTVPVMENLTDANSKPLMGIIVNMADYVIGADKGGQVATFEDFDIDFNQEKYLIETRCSGALVQPKSAMVLVLDRAAAAAGGDTGSGD